MRASYETKRVLPGLEWAMLMTELGEAKVKWKKPDFISLEGIFIVCQCRQVILRPIWTTVI